MSTEAERAADLADELAAAASLKQLLSSLPAGKAQAFTASDQRLLVKKGFYEKWRLQRATWDDLQGPPGEAVKPVLIRVLLTAFNPSALQQGRTGYAKHTASVSITASLYPLHQSLFSPFFRMQGKSDARGIISSLNAR